MPDFDFNILAKVRRPSKPVLNLLNQKFTRLTPLGLLGRINRNTLWLCRCDCGKLTITSSNKLRIGHTQSCGCLARERAIQANSTHKQCHGGKKSSIYRSWEHMKRRILNPNDRAYKNYGGRGLQLYKPWLKFENFLHDMGYPPSNKHSIERVDNSQGYFPDNCIWATHAIQVMNTRRNQYLTANGETHCVSEWTRRQNIKDSSIIFNRLKRGLSPEQAIGLVPFSDKRKNNGRRKK